MAVTIKDIANKAGVSFSTVSKALNDSPLVKEPTKAKILALAKEMGYEANLAAKNLVSGKSGIIGIYCSQITNPFYADIIRYITIYFEEDGLTTAISSGTVKQAKKLFSRLSTEAILVFDHDPDETWGEHAVYAFDSHYHDRINSLIDFKSEGMKKAVEFLIQTGHKNILCLAERDQKVTLPTNNNVIKNVFLEEESSEEAYTEAIRMFNSNEIDAVVCSSYEVCSGVFFACKNEGISVPEDASIIHYHFRGAQSEPLPFTWIGVDNKKLSLTLVNHLLIEAGYPKRKETISVEPTIQNLTTLSPK
ncbi:LacI family DNA-binding transcriptional regulator [Jeotgalibacillus sp. R-1-5s-1]|uniref:LacI family DNA-binding transcriptional regulator n=1 Tax=Jeotgalibacillus sp. R-1-5s-1 TaxID=2555897 RepID=UPI00141B6AC9|nr:LacI family DNA-binding transcriptional regulator [Jeotgalibacillus sp. R-1-5s-1]